MPTHLLKRTSDQGRPQLLLTREIALAQARVHEACGRARRSFAMWLAAHTEGPVFWIAPLWLPDQPNPDGVQAFFNPGRLTFISPHRPEDILWTMEEVLRSGAVPLCIADVPGPPGLTAVRRMHLAAENGAAEKNGPPPIGLLLTPAEGGAQGVESRWQMQPAHAPGREGWHLTRSRARTAPVKSWCLQRGPKGLTPKERQTEDSQTEGGQTEGGQTKSGQTKSGQTRNGQTERCQTEAAAR